MNCGSYWRNWPSGLSYVRRISDLPLFGAGIGLDSLTGTLLLREVHRRYGVDVAAEDLNLDALASLASLASFIEARRG